MSEGQVFYDNFGSSPAWFQKENDKTMFPPENVAIHNLEKWWVYIYILMITKSNTYIDYNNFFLNAIN